MLLAILPECIKSCSNGCLYLHRIILFSNLLWIVFIEFYYLVLLVLLTLHSATHDTRLTHGHRKLCLASDARQMPARCNISKSGVRGKISKSYVRCYFLWPCIRRAVRVWMCMDVLIEWYHLLLLTLLECAHWMITWCIAWVSFLYLHLAHQSQGSHLLIHPLNQRNIVL